VKIRLVAEGDKKEENAEFLLPGLHNFLFYVMLKNNSDTDTRISHE